MRHAILLKNVVCQVIAGTLPLMMHKPKQKDVYHSIHSLIIQSLAGIQQTSQIQLYKITNWMDSIVKVALHL